MTRYEDVSWNNSIPVRSHCQDVFLLLMGVLRIQLSDYLCYIFTVVEKGFEDYIAAKLCRSDEWALKGNHRNGDRLLSTGLFRLFGANAEGVSFAIVLTTS